MTRKITQEERLDLNNVKEETEAYTKSMDIKEIMKQSIPDLLAENQRLKIQNNKMKRLLKDLDYWLGQGLNLNYFKGEIMSFVLTKDYIMEEKKKKIEEVLKKVEE